LLQKGFECQSKKYVGVDRDFSMLYKRKGVVDIILAIFCHCLFIGVFKS
jgi:hypothetical protein